MLDSTTRRSFEKAQLIAALDDGEIVRILRGNCSAYVEIKNTETGEIKEVKIHG